jgi:hypothetical protein
MTEIKVAIALTPFADIYTNFGSNGIQAMKGFFRYITWYQYKNFVKGMIGVVNMGKEI